MYKLIITDSYLKRAKLFFVKHPEVLKQYEKFVKLLCLNPHHPSLRLHKLSGRLGGVFSVSINISYRVLINIVFKDNHIVLIDIGSHDELY